jgi:hypothetical protein
MSEGARVVLVLALDVAWCVYCGVLSHILRQSPRTNAIATMLGCLVVAWAWR